MYKHYLANYEYLQTTLTKTLKEYRFNNFDSLNEKNTFKNLSNLYNLVILKNHSLKAESKKWGFRLKVHVRENAETAFALTTSPQRTESNYIAYNGYRGGAKPHNF